MKIIVKLERLINTLRSSNRNRLIRWQPFSTEVSVFSSPSLSVGERVPFLTNIYCSVGFSGILDPTPLTLKFSHHLPDDAMTMARKSVLVLRSSCLCRFGKWMLKRRDERTVTDDRHRRACLFQSRRFEWMFSFHASLVDNFERTRKQLKKGNSEA